MNKTEYILCSAIYFDDGIEYVHQPINIVSGYVICGHRHHNCFMTISILCKNIIESDRFNNETQGFLTNLNRFVDRNEAGIIAFNAGQTNTLITKLHSENLY